MKILPTIFFLALAYIGNAQNYSRDDTVNIYKLICSQPSNAGTLFYRDLFPQFNSLDIDGDPLNWYLKEKKKSEPVVHFGPILYRIPILKYLDSLSIKEDTAYFYKQIENNTFDNLDKYLKSIYPEANQGDIFVNSRQKKIYRKDKLVGLSSILFTRHNIAFVKIENRHTRNKKNNDLDEIIVLEKGKDGWQIKTSLKEKSPDSYY